MENGARSSVAVRTEVPQAGGPVFCLKHHMRAIGGGDCPGCLEETARRLEVPQRVANVYAVETVRNGRGDIVSERVIGLPGGFVLPLPEGLFAPIAGAYSFADAMAEGLVP